MGRNFRTRRPRNPEPFKAEIIKLWEQLVSYEKICEHIIDKYDVYFNTATLSRAHCKWSGGVVKKKTTAPKDNSAPYYLSKLEPYKVQILEWDRMGFGAPIIAGEIL
jgi:hypothetical protein